LCEFITKLVFCFAHTCSEFFLSTSSEESVLIQGDTLPTTSVFQSLFNNEIMK
jgi:hypothetical protein